MEGIRHEEISDTTTVLFTNLCHNVATKPPLRPLIHETLPARSANTNNNARLDNSQDVFIIYLFFNSPSNLPPYAFMSKQGRESMIKGSEK